MNTTSTEAARERMSLTQLFNDAGYALVEVLGGYRVTKPEANLYHAFWSYSTVYNVSTELVLNGKRTFHQYREIIEVKEKRGRKPKVCANGTQVDSNTYYW